MRGVWAHTTYEGLAYRPERPARNPRAVSGSGTFRPRARYAVATPTNDSLRYSCTACSGTRKDLPTRIAGR